MECICDRFNELSDSQVYLGTAMIDRKQRDALDSPVFLPQKFFFVHWFSGNIFLQQFITVRNHGIPILQPHVFHDGYIRGKLHVLLNNHICGELISDRLIHTWQVNPVLVDFVNKDNSWDFDYLQSMKQNTGLRLNAVFCRNNQNRSVKNGKGAIDLR